MNLANASERVNATSFHEHSRVNAAQRYLKEDLKNLKNLDDLVTMISRICEAPIAYISLIDDIHQRLIAKIGIDVEVVERAETFCNSTIKQNDLVLITDASCHPDFAANKYVTGEPHVRFYAGMPVRTLDGRNIGTICVIDTQPKSLSTYQLEALKMLSSHVIYLLELRLALNVVNEHKQLIESSQIMLKEKYTAQNRQLQSLATVMSHQISGPVATMKGLMYLINTLPGEESKEYLPLMNLVLEQMDEAVKVVTAGAFAAVEQE